MSFNHTKVPPVFNNLDYQNAYSPYFNPYNNSQTNFNYPSLYNFAQVPSANYFPFQLSRQLGYYQYLQSYSPFPPSLFSMQMPQYQQRIGEFWEHALEQRQAQVTIKEHPTPIIIDLCQQSEEKIVKKEQPKSQEVIEKPKQKVEETEKILRTKRTIKPLKIDEFYVDYTKIKFATRAKPQCSVPSKKKQNTRISQKLSAEKLSNEFQGIKHKKIKKAKQAIMKNKRQSRKSDSESEGESSQFIPLQIKIGPQHQCQVPKLIYLTSQQWPQFQNKKMNQLKNLLIRKFY